MPDEPDGGCGEDGGEVVDEVLQPQQIRITSLFLFPQHGKEKGTTTHDSDVVEQTILNERIGQALVVASPFLRVTVAYGVEDPGKIDPRAAAREQQVVVELVLLGSRTLKRGALDAQDDRVVVRREKNVPSESVCGVFPTERKALFYGHQT